MSFSGDVAAHIEKCRKRLAYTAKTATLAVCNDARIVGPSVANPDANKGGRMPVDTNNLRNSMAASISGIPSGQTEGNEKKTGDDVAAMLIRWKPGQSLFYAGFTANYARQMEYRYGFMRGAVMKWGELVRKAAEESKRKIP